MLKFVLHGKISIKKIEMFHKYQSKALAFWRKRYSRKTGNEIRVKRFYSVKNSFTKILILKQQ